MGNLNINIIIIKNTTINNHINTMSILNVLTIAISLFLPFLFLYITRILCILVSLNFPQMHNNND